ncbi:MAG: hypoxanthine-guanine phosphoribosyltransferase [Gammaproteobacteria bacterium]|nr:MAG: hypoxanthine-guanine phosphoribosyltransferase [Gammaproteobacteria bacterium]
MLEVQEANQILSDADCLYSEAAVEAAIATIAAQIIEEYASLNPVVICLMNGGLIFCGKLLTRLDFPLEVDYLHVTRYGQDTEPGSLQWIVTPQQTLANRHVLVVDDILDQGKTLLSVIKSCRDQGAESVRCAVLVDKQHDRKADQAFSADFVGLEVEDRFLFGYGMDYKGYWRNAPGIYAIKGK